MIGANQEVVTLFLTLFSVGIALGSLLCNRLLKGEIHATFVPFGAVGMTLFIVDLFFATRHTLAASPGQLLGAAAFLAQPASWRIVADLLLVSVSGDSTSSPFTRCCSTIAKRAIVHVTSPATM